MATVMQHIAVSQVRASQRRPRPLDMAMAGCRAAVVVALLLAIGCVGTDHSGEFSSTSAVNLGTPDSLGAPKSDTASIKSLDAKSTDGLAANGDGSQAPDSTLGNTDGSAANSGDAVSGADGGNAGNADQNQAADGNAAADAGGPADSGAGEDAGEPADAGEPEMDVEPVADIKKDSKDNGEDPANPWYNIPLPDQYVAPDLPDADAGPTETASGSIPPVCSPLIGSVSVTESVGPGGKLDVIVWVDTSGSMTEEAGWISTNLASFTQFLQNKNIDFHLILIGVTQGMVKLCVGAPLGNPATCDSANPAVFKCVKKPIQSTDGLSKLILYYPDYKAFLRPDAAKNIIAVSDDNSSLTAVNFTTQWENLQVANALPKAFTYHGIVSFSNDADPTNPMTKCSTGATYSKVHIELAKQTNGYLFQLCKKDWTPAFENLAKAVAATAKPVCTYNLPVAAAKKYNPANVKVSHLENGVVVPLTKIDNGGLCGGAPDGWFYDNNAAPKTVTLCDEQCKKLVGGSIVFNFGCAL